MKRTVVLPDGEVWESEVKSPYGRFYCTVLGIRDMPLAVLGSHQTMKGGDRYGNIDARCPFYCATSRNWEHVE